MNINFTLFGQTITFMLFVWFCMKFVWPPIMNALEQRKTKIADGLAAAERGALEHKLAKKRATETLHDAKQQAQEIINQAQKRASEIAEESKDNARAEAERIVAAANAEIEQEVNRAREQLRGQVVSLAVAGAGKVLKKEIDAKANEQLLQDLVAQL
ncbi:MAG: F0F1 ATP synthase subunit B [Halobacteria archaeon]|nr:F0F1 ATP synthase subunit B [Halobacteria archaeon]